MGNIVGMRLGAAVGAREVGSEVGWALGAVEVGTVEEGATDEGATDEGAKVGGNNFEEGLCVLGAVGEAGVGGTTPQNFQPVNTMDSSERQRMGVLTFKSGGLFRPL